VVDSTLHVLNQVAINWDNNITCCHVQSSLKLHIWIHGGDIDEESLQPLHSRAVLDGHKDHYVTRSTANREVREPIVVLPAKQQLTGEYQNGWHPLQ